MNIARLVDLAKDSFDALIHTSHHQSILVPDIEYNSLGTEMIDSYGNSNQKLNCSAWQIYVSLNFTPFQRLPVSIKKYEVAKFVHIDASPSSGNSQY